MTACYYPTDELLEVHVVGSDGRIWVAWKDYNGLWAGNLHPLTAPDTLPPATPITSASYPVNEQLEVFVGDETWFARVLWKHHNGMWAPCVTPLGPRTGAMYVAAAETRRVAQVSATPDFLSAGVGGVDLGANTSHGKEHFVFFGDVPRPKDVPGPVHDADVVAQVVDFAQDGVSLQVIRTAADGFFAPFTIRRLNRALPDLVPSTNQTPSGAFSDGAFVYVFVLLHDRPGPGWPDPVTHLTRSPNPASGKPFDEVFRWSESKFLQVAPVVVDNASVPGLPSATGRGVVMLGGGLIHPGRIDGGDGVHLAWMPLQRGVAPRLDEIWYHRGEAGWSAGDHDSAAAMWRLPGGYTSLSLTFVADARRWVALYSRGSGFGDRNRPQGAVVARVAPSPTGPWSEEIPLFDPCREGAFGSFMHWPNLDDLDERDPSQQTGGTGHAYGAFVLEPLTGWREEDRTLTLHYLMSTFRPYQVHHMVSEFRID